MKSILNIAVLSLLLATILPFQAEAGKYGMAGCGLGSLVWQDKPGKIQILASTTNDLVSPQTSAITSGTSNCVEDRDDRVAELFININHEALKKDISRGEGETIVHLSQIYRCSNSDTFGVALKQNFQRIFPAHDVSAAQVQKTIRATLESHEQLAKSCKTLS